MHGPTASTVVTLLIATFALSSSIAHGQAAPRQTDASLDHPLLNVTVGQVGIDQYLDNSWRYGIEYRFSPLAHYRLVPSIGIAVGDNHANFIYAELRRDFRVAGHWLVTPSFGLGRFNNRPRFNLGQSLEFRSGLEVSRQFNHGYRLGVALFHLSNGGLSDQNPGTEEVVLSVSIPLGDG